MREQDNPQVIDTEPATVTDTRGVAVLMGASAVFGMMVGQAVKEGNEGFAHACNFASNTLEQMARGDLPIAGFENEEDVVKQFLASENPVQKELDALDAQEEPYVLTN